MEMGLYGMLTYDHPMEQQKVMGGGVLLAVGTALILWTAIGDASSTITLGGAAVASLLLAGGSLLLGTSEGGRSV